jgi:hypothetical protein
MDHRDDDTGCSFSELSMSTYQRQSSAPINFTGRRSDDSVNSADNTMIISSTPEEERKLRRRLLNRECARSLRNRRLQYVQSLEQKVQTLEEENHMLHMKMKLLEMTQAPSCCSSEFCSQSPQKYRTTEVLQAIPLHPEQVKNAPILAFEVNVHIADEVSAAPAFVRQASGSSSSSIASPTYSDSTLEDGDLSKASPFFDDLDSGMFNESRFNQMDNIHSMMEQDVKNNVVQSTMFSIDGSTGGGYNTDEFLQFGSQADW